MKAQNAGLRKKMMNIFSFLRDEAVKKESRICEGLCKMAKTFFHGGI